MKYYVIEVNLTNYYHGPFLVRSETSKLFHPHYLYDFYLNTWIEDKYAITNDHIIGYDPSEDVGYRIYRDDIMEEMVEISEERAFEIIINKEFNFSVFMLEAFIRDIDLDKLKEIITDTLNRINS